MFHYRNPRRGDAGRRDRAACLQARGRDRGARRRLYRRGQPENQGRVTREVANVRQLAQRGAAMRLTRARAVRFSYRSAATKLSITNFRPALSKSTVSLGPSTATTSPGPNLLCITRDPGWNTEEDEPYPWAAPSIIGPEGLAVRERNSPESRDRASKRRQPGVS